MDLRVVDRLLAGYIGFVTVVIVLRGTYTVAAGRWLLIAHVLFGLLLWLFTRLAPHERVGAFLHDFYPLIFLTAFYAEIGVLNAQFEQTAIFAHDTVVQSWEVAIFGGQISYDWIRHSPSVFWSAVLHLAYFSYYPIVVLGPLLLYWRGSADGARRTVLAMMIAFVMCYVVFVLYPVAGPNWVFDHPTGAVRDVWSARLVYNVLEGGASVGAAFPSSHVAATGAVVLAIWREWRALALAFAGPAILLMIGTVYCQMHYGVDVLGGLAVVAATMLSPRLLEER